jgi:hypothetical protein
LSYCRFGNDSDVYLYEHINDFIQCCACRLTAATEHGFDNRNFKTVWEAHAHLVEHQKAGHKVPKYALKRLRGEMTQAQLKKSA